MVYVDGVNLQPSKVPPQLQPNSTAPPPASLDGLANPPRRRPLREHLVPDPGRRRGPRPPHLRQRQDRLLLHPGRLYRIATLALVYPNLETVVVGTARVSFALALLRLRRDRWWRMLIWMVIVGLVVITMFALVLARLTQCIPMQKLQYGNMEGTCRGDGKSVLYVGWASGAWSAFSDFALIAMSWIVVWSVKMRKREKIGMALAMSIGVVSGGLTIFRYAWISPGFMADFYEYGWFGWILMSAEGMSSLIAASIPALRAFLLEMRADFRARFRAPITYFHRTWGNSTTTLRRGSSTETPRSRKHGIKVERNFVVSHDAPSQNETHGRFPEHERSYAHCDYLELRE
ncbi:hypothetical protein PG987_005273 [Apiospora arundinis]